MQSRAVRLTLLSLILLAGAVGVFFSWDTYRRAADVLSREREVDVRLDRMSEAAAALRAAQQAYVAPGQQRGEWLTRATASVQQLYDDAAALRSRAIASESSVALTAFSETVDAAVKADDRIRENLRVDQELMAADIVYNEARQSVDSMTTQLRALRSSEDAAAEAERQALFARAAPIVGACAFIWVFGLIVLAKAPTPRVIHEPVPVMEASAVPLQAEAMDRPEPSSVDLGAIADVCTDLARMTDASALPPALERLANALDARGIIVWLGAGEELFVAAAYGYREDIISRLGPIARAADNPTADAWRSGQLHVVPSSPMAFGAIVAPLLRPNGCFGVLAAEVRHQREHDAATRAAATLIAAQLSSILAAGPAPSSAETPVAAAEGANGARASA